jgi:hypothetical protein
MNQNARWNSEIYKCSLVQFDCDFRNSSWTVSAVIPKALHAKLRVSRSVKMRPGESIDTASDETAGENVALQNS